MCGTNENSRKHLPCWLIRGSRTLRIACECLAITRATHGALGLVAGSETLNRQHRKWRAARDCGERRKDHETTV